MASPDAPAVIIDNGSGFCKLGFAGQRQPQCTFHTVVGHQQAELKVGENAWNDRGVLNLEWPIERGIITNWDNIEKIWSYSFSELHVASVERPVLLTEHPLPSKADREKTTEIMLETFNVPAVFLAFKPVLSLYAAGKLNGVVLQSGYGATHALPCYGGNPLNDAALRLNLAGNDLTNYLTQLLSKAGCSLTNYNTINDIKEKLCYVALDIEKEKAKGLEKNYELPDGQVITIGKELFSCTEALFHPSLIGTDSPGIHQMLFDSIAKCDEGIRKDLYANIVLAGGSTLHSGITERMQKELTAIGPATVDIKITSSPAEAPHHSAFIGAAILTSLPTFKELWLSKKEYDEVGPSIVHTKFV